jgi:hypothetical protein
MPSPIFQLTDTWNVTTTVFYGIALDVNNVASASGSRLLRLATNGVTQFSVDPSLGIRVGNPAGGNTGYGTINASGYFIEGAPIGATYATLNSPIFTGDPQAPTPATADNDTSIATTAFVKNQGYATLVAPTFSGFVSVPTAAQGDNSQRAASTAYVDAGLATKQPLDDDLTTLSGLTGTNTIYFRSGPGAWTPVVMGGNMSFAGGILNSVGGAGGGNVSSSGLITVGQIARWHSSFEIESVDFSTMGIAPLASPTFTGDPKAPTPATADNDTSIATTAFVKANLGSYLPLAGGTLTGNLTVNGGLIVGSTSTFNGIATFTVSPEVFPASGQSAGYRIRIQGAATGTLSYLNNAALRWTVQGVAPSTEGGSNTGSDFQITRYNDAGTLLDTPLQIGRVDGATLISKANPNLILAKTASGQQNMLIGRTGANPRWALIPGDGSAEGGSNTGSDFQITRYNDAGGIIDTPFIMSRANAAATFGGRIIPSGGIQGKLDGSVAATPFVGELLVAAVASSAAAALTNATNTPFLQLPLGPGDYDVWGMIGLTGSAGTIIQYILGGMNVGVSGTSPNMDNGGAVYIPMMGATPFTYISQIGYTLPAIQVLTSGSVTVWLNAFVGFTPGSVNAFGYIKARRVR